MPVGLEPSLSCAVSSIGEPAGALGEALELSSGCSGGFTEDDTTTSSPGSVHAVGPGVWLLGSPE